MLPIRVAILPLFLPLFIQAQDPISTLLNDQLYFGPAYFESAQDSADFIQFRTGLVPLGLNRSKETTDIQYCLAWSENQHGGLWLVTHGDGRVMGSTEPEVFPLSDPLLHRYRTSEGRRVLVLVHEVPCGLICRNVWYYIEE